MGFRSTVYNTLISSKTTIGYFNTKLSLKLFRLKIPNIDFPLAIYMRNFRVFDGYLVIGRKNTGNFFFVFFFFYQDGAVRNTIYSF